MSYILAIDTSDKCVKIIVWKGAEKLFFETEEMYLIDDFSFPHWVVSVLQKNGLSLYDITIFACILGPGSYTGLRVGLASVKAWCYALRKPLIPLNLLEIATNAILLKNENYSEETLFLPYQKARENEIFAALYFPDLQEKRSPMNWVFDANGCTELINEKRPIIAIGVPYASFESSCKAFPNISFVPMYAYSETYFWQAFYELIQNKYIQNAKVDIFTIAPLYCKPPYITQAKK